MGKTVKKILGFALAFVAIVFTFGAGTGFAAALINFSASILIAAGMTFVPMWLAVTVGGLILGGGMVLLSELAKPKLPNGNELSQQRLNKRLEPEAFRKILFGETAAACDIRYWETWGKDNKNYDEVLAVATHKIASFGQLWLEEEDVNFDGSGINTDSYGAALKWFGITEGAGGVGPVLGESGALWNPGTSKKTRMTGLAYFVLRYSYDQDKFPQGFPSRYTQVAKGALVYDPRLDSTRGGEGTHRADDQTTWSYTSGRMLVEGTSSDPQLYSPSGLTIDGSVYNKVKIRIKLVSGTPTGNAQLFYSTSGHSWSASYVKTITLPTLSAGDWTELEFDMSNLTAGGTDWITNTITRIRFDPTTVDGVDWEIDWVAVEDADGNNILLYQFGSTVDGWSGTNATITQTGRDIGRNPALQALWYLLGWRITDPTDSEHITLVAGMGVDPEDIDFATFIQAANDCETEGYFCDCALSTGDSHETNIQMIEASCAGKMLDTGGLYSFHVNVDDTAAVAVAFDENDIVGPVEWIPKSGIKDNFQTIEGTFTDPSSLYQQRSYPAVTDAAYLAADGFERSTSANFQSVQDHEQAQKLARLILNQNRFQGVFRAPFNMKAMLAKNWSVITLTFGRYAFSSKLFRVVAYELSPEGSIALSLRELHASIWTPGSVTELPAPSVGSTFNPRDKIAVTGDSASALTIVGGEGAATDHFVDGVLVEWDDPGSICQRTDIQYRRAGDTDWIEAPPAVRQAVQQILTTTLSLTAYEIRLRHISIYGVVGDWSSPVLEVTTGNDAGSATIAETRYKRSVAPPSTPTGNDPSGWTIAQPTGTDALWASTVQRAPSGVAISLWSTPNLLTNPNARGVYGAGTTYYQFDSVTYNGGTYLCIVSSTTGNAPSGTADANGYWSVIAAPGTPGTPGDPPAGFTATIDLTSTSAGVNLRTLANANGYTGLSDATITFEVESGVTVTGIAGDGGAAGGIAVDTGTWPTGDYTITLSLVVKSGGKIYGGGGTGGVAEAWGATIGGDAVYARVPISVECQTGGEIKGGGGGGGMGGSWMITGLPDPETGEVFVTFEPGGSGGGGFPNGEGTYGGASDGTTSGGGAGQSGGAVGGDRVTGNGGAGGNAATAGTTGSVATGTESARRTKTSPGVGAAAGYAVRKNGYTVPVTGSGTITGTQA